MKRVEEIDDKCPACKGKMKRVYMKNPFIDDFSEDCLNEDCHEFMSGSQYLINSARRIAESEEN